MPEHAESSLKKLDIETVGGTIPIQLDWKLEPLVRLADNSYIAVAGTLRSVQKRGREKLILNAHKVKLLQEKTRFVSAFEVTGSVVHVDAGDNAVLLSVLGRTHVNIMEIFLPEEIRDLPEVETICKIKGQIKTEESSNEKGRCLVRLMAESVAIVS